MLYIFRSVVSLKIILLICSIGAQIFFFYKKKEPTTEVEARPRRLAKTKFYLIYYFVRHKFFQMCIKKQKEGPELTKDNFKVKKKQVHHFELTSNILLYHTTQQVHHFVFLVVHIQPYPVT